MNEIGEIDAEYEVILPQPIYIINKYSISMPELQNGDGSLSLTDVG